MMQLSEITYVFPWALLLLLPCLALTIGFGLRGKRGGTFSRVFVLILRSTGLLLLIFAMAGTGIRMRTDVTATMFAIDLSESASMTRENALSIIQDANAYRTPTDAVGIVAFGETAAAEQLPAVKNNIGTLQTFVNQDYTNIAAALSTAQSTFPENMKRRVVLVSDGLENIGSALTTARALREARIEVDVLPLQNGAFDEVQLVGISVPQHMNKGLAYELEAELYSMSDNTTTLSLYKNNRLIATADITVRSGANRFVFTDTADESGGAVYRAEIQPARDHYVENNRVFAYAQVQAEPNILVVNYENSAAAIIDILQASDANVTMVQAAAAPLSVNLLHIYDSIILADAPLDELPEGFDAALESYVRNMGGGVLIVGGENSYALGGYYKSALETLLPVEMRLKDTQESPNLSMVIVLDRSGSMTSGQYGVSKLALAKEAVIRAVDALSANDVFGVIAFDDNFTWTVPFAPIGRSASAIQQRIGEITEGGGTSILPGLTEAVRVLQGADTKLKHIILLTDGQAEQSGYDSVLADMSAAGITLSSIAVGGDSDQRLLQRLATEGGGRYYYTDEFTDLPKIFTQETTLAGKEYLNNRTFHPIIGAVSPILANISALSPLHGYISTTAKPRADVVLQSDTEEPILAAWQYGLGRAVAWTTDVSDRWARNWLASGEGETLLRNAVSWTLRRQGDGNAMLEATANGKDCVLTLTSPISDNITAAKGVLADADGTTHTLDFHASAPGTFRAEVANLPPGAYVAGITLNSPDGESLTTLGVSVSYSPEYDMRHEERGLALLTKIAEITGGRVLQTAEDIYRPIETDAFTSVSIANELLWTALILLLLDIALRRFPFLLHKLEAALRKIFTSIPKTIEAPKPIQTPTPIQTPKPEPTPAANTSGALLARKKKRDGRS